MSRACNSLADRTPVPPALANLARLGQTGFLLLAACGSGDEPDQAAPMANEPVPVWWVAPEPLISVGTAHGDSNRQLFEVVSALRLPEGRIVIANAGTSELRFVDSAGRFQGTVGRIGSGPGEYRALSRLYRAGPDSLLVLDRGLGRLSQVDLRGHFGGLVPAESLSQDPAFAMDVWLFRGFWVEGALTDDQRAAVKRLLVRLPLPSSPAWRLVRIDDAGRSWLREPPGLEGTHWTVFDPLGTPVATAVTPPRFELMDVGDGWVLGRWRDEAEVEHVRLHALTPLEERAPLPEWLVRGGNPAAGAERLEDRRRTLVVVGRNLMVAQETYRRRRGTYATAIDSLVPDRDRAVELSLLHASTRGWIAVASWPGGGLCAMGMGDAPPPGWPEGAVRCAGD
jgi:hypothetical protein